MKKVHLLLIFSLGMLTIYAQPCGIDFHLNGTDDHITIPNTDAINLQNTRNRTVEFWFKASDITTRQVIYEEGSQLHALYFYLENDQLYLGAYRSNAGAVGNRRLFRSGIGTLAVDTWHHVALVLSDTGTDVDFRWYLDGVLQDDQIGTQVNNRSGNISIGHNGGNLRFPSGTTWTASSVGGSTAETYNGTFGASDANAYNFNGDLSLFRIWNTPRTQTEIDNNKESLLISGTDLVAYLDAGDLTYVPNGLTTLSASVEGNGNNVTYTWSGATGTDWNTGSNWVGGSAPLSNKLEKITIPLSGNYPEIASEIRIGELTVVTGVQLEISPGGTLNVYYDLTNNGLITVTDDGSLLYNNCDAIAGSGTFFVVRDSPNYPSADFFSIWSTPVFSAEATLGQVFAGPIRAFSWDASANPGVYVERGGSYAMIPGEGIFVRPDDMAGTQTRTFGGRLNNGIIDLPIYFNSPTDNFNLIGNPYASAIDWFKLYEDNSDVITGTMYYWNQTVTGANNQESDYITFNSTGSNPPGATEFISTAQGVFTESLQPGTLTFKNTHRVVSNNSQFFRSDDRTSDLDGRIWLKLSNADRTSTLLLGLLEEATNGYDEKYDGRYLDEGYLLQFYSLLVDRKLAIQARAELNGEDVSIPLGFKTATAGNFTIEIDLHYLNEEVEVILEDKELGVFADLRAGGYLFNTSVQENNERFVLNFQDTSVLGVEDDMFQNDNPRVSVSFDDHSLIVDTDIEDTGVLELYDISGKKVFQNVFEERRYFVPGLSRGIFILNLKLDNGKTIFRKLIK
ncbi:LamG-like jellyroll fold domain-containing protein [Sungkyunkwania multivorans]|uniref:LamG-like jellyroll fold domain-containing protein n=1 Tax=Sungkyunkwania multivorans TaxID=1173618 RepID=A0ABW3CYW9_9FLAO